jgi:hypothetical protein
MVKKGEMSMMLKKRPTKIYFYASLCSKLHILTEAEKNSLVKKSKLW